MMPSGVGQGHADSSNFKNVKFKAGKEHISLRIKLRNKE